MWMYVLSFLHTSFIRRNLLAIISSNTKLLIQVLALTTLLAMGNATPVKQGATLHIYESMKEDDYCICVLDVSCILQATEEEISDAVGTYAFELPSIIIVIIIFFLFVLNHIFDNTH